nr:MAG TPA: hypothetical protein [Caudoviricetes sp.]
MSLRGWRGGQWSEQPLIFHLLPVISQYGSRIGQPQYNNGQGGKWLLD